MQKLFLGILLLVLVLVFPLSTRAGVNVGVNISLPLPIVFVAPPELIVLPETNVYVVPDVEEEIYFYGGWWWRPWEGGWYRSRHYDSGWSYHQQAPSFYGRIPSDWRNDYRERRWRGSQWDYQPIPHQQVQQNWSAWQKSRYWERHKSWGVQGLQPRMRSQRSSHDVYSGQSQSQMREVQQQRSRQHRGAGQNFRQANPQHSQQQQGAGQKFRQAKPQHAQHQQGAGQKFQKAQPQHSQHQQGNQKGGKGKGKGGKGKGGDKGER